MYVIIMPAYLAGFQAVSINDNPFQKGTFSFESWIEGFKSK